MPGTCLNNSGRVIIETFRSTIRNEEFIGYLSDTTGIDLSNGAGIPELIRFKKLFQEYKIVVYYCLSCEDIIFEGQIDSSKGINLLYDDVERHYDVIAKINVATA